uniref:RING-type E3 ubiquitin transferase n=1 Tax=Arabidopsis thaliana TaxID=3702 RepID=Q9ZVV9_ARATH|nr:putative protein kinase [Arabidopsis thaliana]
MVDGERRDESVAIAIDRDKGSQAALKWAVDNLLTPGETLTLIHVKVKQTLANNGTQPNKSGDDVKELFLPFRCFCTRKDVSFASNFINLLKINCEEVVLENVDAAEGIIEYVQENAIDILVLGASKITLLKRLKAVDVTNAVIKGAPNFCTVYAISKGKISSVRSATSSPPPLCTIRPQLPARSSNANNNNFSPRAQRRLQSVQSIQDEIEIKSPYLRKEYDQGTYQALVSDSDLSFVSSDRPSMDWFEDNRSNYATSSSSSEKQSIDLCSSYSAFSTSSQESGRLSSLSMYSQIEQGTTKFSDSHKIGEGSYGTVYKGTLDYTPVAIKVVRPDATQGRSQFQQEVEVLTCIRHPNMVLLLGACAEYGCLVYEYMSNGSLDDCLLRRGNSPVLSWQLRFRIAAEIATSLNFLHQLKPEPLVHRDLKPANILLDQHMVSKISDVGLARLVPPTIDDIATHYRMTSTAGTLCYIDPEYQQTGMLGTKSDIYSFGIVLLQILTAKTPMGLTNQVEKAIEEGNFAKILDPLVTDWPIEEALILAKIGLQCAELRRKDRPDLGTVVLPGLKRLMNLAEENMSITRPSFFTQDYMKHVFITKPFIFPLFFCFSGENKRSISQHVSI